MIVLVLFYSDIVFYCRCHPCFPGEVHLHLRILQLGGGAIGGCSDERVLVLEDTQGDGENPF